VPGASFPLALSLPGLCAKTGNRDAIGSEKSGMRLEKSWTILGCAWLLAFAMYCPMFCIPPIVHILKDELHVTYADLGLLFSLPLTMLVVLAIPAGFFSDRLDAHRAAGIGAIVLAAGSLMRCFSKSFNLLLILTGVYGVGYSMVLPSLPKLVGLWFPREKVGLATGVYATGISMGCTVPLAITLPLIFPLTRTIGGTFFLWSMPAVAAVVLWWVATRDSSLPSRPVNAPPLHGTTGRLRLPWRNRNLWLIALLLFLDNAHFYTWSAWAPKLLTMKGAQPELAAFIASVRGWASVPAMFLMPWASYKTGLRKPFIWGAGLVLVGASWSVLHITVPLSWPLMVLVGCATSGTFPMILALPLEILPTQSIGLISGTILSIGYIGGFAGPWLAGYVVDSLGNFDVAFLFLLVMAILWAFIGLLLPETGSRARQVS